MSMSMSKECGVDERDVDGWDTTSTERDVDEWNTTPTKRNANGRNTMPKLGWRGMDVYKPSLRGPGDRLSRLGGVGNNEPNRAVKVDNDQIDELFQLCVGAAEYARAADFVEPMFIPNEVGQFVGPEGDRGPGGGCDRARRDDVGGQGGGDYNCRVVGGPAPA